LDVDEDRQPTKTVPRTVLEVGPTLLHRDTTIQNGIVAVFIFSRPVRRSPRAPFAPLRRGSAAARSTLAWPYRQKRGGGGGYVTERFNVRKGGPSQIEELFTYIYIYIFIYLYLSV